MYVCMYARTHACMYDCFVHACMYVCMYVCMHASNVNMFKNIIDNYLVKAGYTLKNTTSGVSIS